MCLGRDLEGLVFPELTHKRKATVFEVALHLAEQAVKLQQLVLVHPMAEAEGEI